MRVRELAVPGAYQFIPPTFPDRRGVYCVPLQVGVLAEVVGYRPSFAQVSSALSRRGAVRGPHYADIPPGQAKYVYCSNGAVLDFVVDIRIGSPTFGRYEAIRLDSTGCHAVYVPEGLGHAIVALEDDTVLTYLTSTSYNPAAEHGLNPLDPALGLPMPDDLDLILSDRDRSAPTLAEALVDGTLPRYEDCLERYRSLRETSGLGRPAAARRTVG